MNERKVHLARGESDLGVLPLKEVRELLASGFLRPGDEFWMAGQTGWLPLSQLPAVETPDGGIYHKLKEALTSAAAIAQKSAPSVTSRVASVAGKPTEQLTAATNRMLEDYLPHLGASAQMALAQTSRSADAALRDEGFLRKLFGAVHDLLPRAVCRFVNEEAFVDFCLRHRHRLLGRPGGDVHSSPSK